MVKLEHDVDSNTNQASFIRSSCLAVESLKKELMSTAN